MQPSPFCTRADCSGQGRLHSPGLAVGRDSEDCGPHPSPESRQTVKLGERDTLTQPSGELALKLWAVVTRLLVLLTLLLGGARCQRGPATLAPAPNRASTAPPRALLPPAGGTGCTASPRLGMRVDATELRRDAPDAIGQSGVTQANQRRGVWMGRGPVDDTPEKFAPGSGSLGEERYSPVILRS